MNSRGTASLPNACRRVLAAFAATMVVGVGWPSQAHAVGACERVLSWTLNRLTDLHDRTRARIEMDFDESVLPELHEKLRSRKSLRIATTGRAHEIPDDDARSVSFDRFTHHQVAAMMRRRQSAAYDLWIDDEGGISRSARPDLVLANYLSALVPAGRILVRLGEEAEARSRVIANGRKLSLLEWMSTIPNLEVGARANGWRVLSPRDPFRQIYVPKLTLTHVGWARRRGPSRSFAQDDASSISVTPALPPAVVQVISAEQMAYKTAPTLFGRDYPFEERSRLLQQQPRSHQRVFATEKDWHDAIQAALDQRSNFPQSKLANAPAETEQILKKLVVSTHLAPQRQAAAAQLFDQRFANIPKVILANEYGIFSAANPEFTDAADRIVYSTHGELRSDITAEEIILIGRYEAHCLRRTLNDLVQNAIKRGITRVTARFLTEFTEHLDKQHQRDVALAQLLNESHSREIQDAVFSTVFAEWTIDRSSLRKSGEILMFTASHPTEPFELTVILE